MSKNYELMLKVANMYYLQNMGQEGIARKLYLSRSKVSRLLCDAREAGIVEIIVHNEVERNEFLEREFKKRFGLKDAIITRTNDNDPVDNVVNIAAKYVDTLIEEGVTISISRGKTIEKFADQFNFEKDMQIDVVQIIGPMEMHKNAGHHSEIEVVHKIARAYNGNYHYLLSPFATKNQSTYEAFKEMDFNKVALESALKAELLVSSVGSKYNNKIMEIWGNYLSENDKNLLDEKQAVGVFCGHYFNINGELIDLEIMKYIVGIPIEEIVKKDCRICMSAGPNKVLPILGALRAKLFNILITDENTALEILINDANK